MAPDTSNPRLRWPEIIRLLLVAPVAALAFVLVLAGIVVLTNRIAASNVHLWLVAFPTGLCVLSGAFVAPLRFRRAAAYFISTIFLLYAVSEYLWNTFLEKASPANFGHPLGISVGIYLIARPFLSLAWQKDATGSKRRIFMASGLFVLGVIILTAPFVALTTLLPERFASYVVLLLVLDIIRTTWRWIATSRAKPIATLFSLLGKLWPHLPVGIVVSVVIGGIAAVAGYPNFSPYAAIGGFLAYVGFVTLKIANNFCNPGH